MDLSYLIEAASKALEELRDGELKSALKVVVSRATTLSSNVSGPPGKIVEIQF